MSILRRWLRVLAFVLPALGGQQLASCGPQFAFAGAAQVPSDFFDDLMAGSLSEPVGLAQVPDLPSGKPIRVLFVEQRTGRVGLIVGGTVFTVGTVPGISSTDLERGLLGVAVDPTWPNRPYLYVHCTDGRSGHRIAISRFTLTGDLFYGSTGQLQFASSSRYDILLSPPDNARNHNGGTVRFGRDGKLYVSLGDDATGCPAQDPTELMGKILRLDVTRLPSGAGGPPPIASIIPSGNPFASYADSNAKLVWTVGLRNPFRFHVDSQTGALQIADVGEQTWEEVDFAPEGGMNMGWPFQEALQSYSTCVETPPSPLTAPIAYYDHGVGVAIISAGIYRQPSGGGLRFGSEYDGDCFFLDYYSGIMRRLKQSGGSWVTAPAVPGQTDPNNWGSGFSNVSDALEMADGSVWYVRQSPGEVRRIGRVQSADVASAAPPALVLAAPRPSPSAGNVTLAWSQPAPDRVRLGVYDLGGRRVRSLHEDVSLAAGPHGVVWDGRDDAGAPIEPGLYFVRLEVGDFQRHARVTVIR